MESTRLRTRTAFALALAGAATGWFIAATAVQYLRRVDPLGISPVVLIGVMGACALGWYLRGRSRRCT